MTLRLSRLLMAMNNSHLAGTPRPSSCTSIEWSATRVRDPPHSLHTYRHPAPLGRPEGTAHTLPGASTAETLYNPASCTIEWTANSPPTHHQPMPSINEHTITPITHTTRGEVGAYKEGSRPLSRSLSIERSERFPHCLLEIPLATPWPKQTLRN